MAIQITPLDESVAVSGKSLEIRIDGKLSAQDYDAFVPRMEALMNEYGKLRILLELADFHGWTAGALWEDTKFSLRHFRDIERVAIVGNRAWEKGMAAFCKPFTAAQVKYFDVSEAGDARSWIEQPS